MHATELPIEEPCGADFSTMSGDERRRFCSQCNLHVHDLSAMTEQEAEQVLEEPDVCVRYETDARGRIVFGRAAAMAVLLAATPAYAGGQAAEPDTGWVDWFWGLFESDEDGDSASEVAPVLEEHPSPIPIHRPVSEDDEPERRPIRMGRPARRQPPAQTSH